MSYRNYVSTSSSWYQLLFVFFLVLLLFLLTSILGMALVMISCQLSLTEVMDIMNHPDATNVGIIKLLQVIQTIGLFIIPALIASYFLGTGMASYLRMNTRPSFLSIILVILIMVSWIPVINFTAGINGRLNLPESMDRLEEKIVSLKDSYNFLTLLFLDTRSPAGFVANMFIMAVLPAFSEELLFRGIFQPLFAGLTRSVHWGIIITALIFSFIHLEFYGFLPRFLLGILFGYLFVWTSSIWIPILAHFINNGIIVGYYFFMQPGTGPSKLDELGSHADLSLWLSLGGGILLSGLLFYHERSRRLSDS